MTIHHFVLLKVFDCPAQLSGAASARSPYRYLVTQMEVFNFKSTDLSEQLPLLSVPLLTVMAVSKKSRSEIFFCVRCEDGHLESVSAVLHKSQRDLRVVRLNMELSITIIQNFKKFCRWLQTQVTNMF